MCPPFVGKVKSPIVSASSLCVLCAVSVPLYVTQADRPLDPSPEPWVEGAAPATRPLTARMVEADAVFLVGEMLSRAGLGHGPDDEQTIGGSREAVQADHAPVGKGQIDSSSHSVGRPRPGTAPLIGPPLASFSRLSPSEASDSMATSLPGREAVTGPLVAAT